MNSELVAVVGKIRTRGNLHVHDRDQWTLRTGMKLDRGLGAKEPQGRREEQRPQESGERED